MTLESIEKLRELAADINANEIVDHMQLYPSCVFDGHWLDAWHREFDKLLEAIQAEVDEKYMLLPVDAEGGPIHPGDQMTDYSKRADSLGDARWDVVSVNERAFFDMSGNAHIPIECHHLNPRTVEDVLHDFGNDYAAFLSGIYPFENARQCEVIAKYASELRMRDAE